MADDELLREALLELQFLREREARLLDASKSLVDCLEAYSTATSAGDALASIFTSFAQKIGASLSIVLSAEGPDRHRIVAASDPNIVDDLIHLPFDPYARARNVVFLPALGELPEFLADLGAMIAVPIRADLALLTFCHSGSSFQKTDIELVRRLSGLAAQALRDKELAAQNELLAATIAGSSSGFAISDALNPDHPLIYVNEAFEKLSGYSQDEVLGKNCRLLNAEAQDSSERLRLRQAVARNAPGTFVLRNRRKSGELFWNELTLFPVKDANGTVINLVATQTDVSERIEAAAARDQVRAWMDSALNATADAFLVLDTDKRVALANGAVNLLFPAPGINWEVGSTFDANWSTYINVCEEFGGKVSSLLSAADLNALVESSNALELSLPDGRSVLVRGSRLKDGGLVASATDVTAMKSAQDLLNQRLSAIEAASNGIAITDSAGCLIYLNSAASTLLGFPEPQSAIGEKWRSRYLNEDVYVDADGSVQMRIREQTSQQIQTHAITVTHLETGGTVIVIRDETERLDREEREDKLQQDLLRLQGQEALAHLTAGIAHDFNNLLSVITGSATLVDMNEATPDDTRAHIKRILAAGNQSSSLISRMLDLGADDQTQGTFAVSDVLSDLPNLVSAGLSNEQRFTLNSQDFGLTLRGSASTLSQILINLIFNARDAMPDGGDICLDTKWVKGSPRSDLVVGELTSGSDYLVFSVSDTGTGIPPEIAAVMFDPYFTTKGTKGTGLGLATAALQLRMIGGAIGLKSALNEGTKISLYWPIPREAGKTTSNTTAAASIDLSDLNVMIVDDDADVSSVTSSYLEAHGAQVIQCLDPREALAALREAPDIWSALITDYDMPELNGGALVAEVRKHTTDLPIFVVTALAKRLNDPRLAEGKVRAVFSKPVDFAALSKALTKLNNTSEV